MSRTKPADVRFYFDADVLGLAHVFAALRSDITYPGDPGGVKFKRSRPPCPIKETRTSDDVWIPEVTSRGWLIVTRDSMIQNHTREVNAVREHGARMVALSGVEAVGTFAQLELIMCRWQNILRCLDEPGPFIYAATRTKFRPVPLG
ncbi:hypothetical protein CLV63_12311 [Murinocardiopsis flavida]|uniref:VapC45 PIN like domain-containing protein n=1 Tax=Murinocardiopsis flavida TaxID=645275 RepID=A0A2P8CYY0_9ACTN|nr:hypothetical protein [Murinocardiopsis flavida]PSK90182.1 hypothetical protein CLV63_12311 [Murinocardiopsis flavida]